MYQCPIEDQVPMVVAFVKQVFEQPTDPYVVRSLFELKGLAVLKIDVKLL
jgi:hypothetical protein